MAGIAAAAVIVGCTSNRQALTPITTPSGAHTISVRNVLDQFDIAQIDVTSSAVPKPGAHVLTLTDWQANRVARAAVVGVGITGADLRRQIPVQANVVPIDALLAVWLAAGSSKASEAARHVVDVNTLRHPSTFTYPWAVIDMFVSDIANGTARAGGPNRANHDPGLGSMGNTSTIPGSTGDPCAALKSLYTTTVGRVVGVIGDEGLLIDLAASAITRYRDDLPAGVKPPTEADAGALKTAVEALSVAATLVGAIDPWVATVTADPATNSYAVQPLGGNEGHFRVTLDPGPTTDWPASITACATEAGITLPSLDPTGSPVEWTLADTPYAQFVSADSSLTAMHGTYAANLVYETPNESAQIQGGQVASGTTSAAVVVRRSNANDIRALVATIITGALADLPPAVSATFATSATDTLAALSKLDDAAATSAAVTITYHVPPTSPATTARPPTTTHPPATAPPTTTAADTTLPTTLQPTTVATTVPTTGCIGRTLTGGSAQVLDNISVSGLDGTTLELNPGGTGVFDWAASAPILSTLESVASSIQVRGAAAVNWTADGDTYVLTVIPQGMIATATVDGRAIDLGEQWLKLFLTAFSAATCDGSSFTFPRSGQVFS